MTTISTYSNLNGAVLALENVHQRLFHIEAAVALLQGIEHGEIKDLEHTSVDFTSLVTEALNGAMSGIFDDCDEILGYLETQGRDRFLTLVENAKLVKQASNAHDTPEGRAQS